MLPYFADRARESSSSEGTGDFTLGGAFPGYQTFADGGAEGETVDYAIEAVDADGIPTGQWETGKGSYSAGVLTRTTPEDGSEALPVDFGPGTKNVFITVTAVTFDMLLANVASGTEAVALSEPSGSTASGYRGAAFGFSSTATGDGSTALGSSAYAPADYATAIGYNAYATGVNSSAFGFAAHATEANAVALGYNSLGDIADAISVGRTGGERRIVHVADGVDPTDAATVGQLPAPGGDFSGPASATDNAAVRFDGTGGQTGRNSGLIIGDVSASNLPLSTGAGTGFSLTATDATATTGASQAGKNAQVSASNAVASTDTAGAAAGGSFSVIAGNAARNTSGNAKGGNIALQAGTGIGTGTSGRTQIVRSGSAASPTLVLGSGTNTGWYDVGSGDWAFSRGGTTVFGMTGGNDIQINGSAGVNWYPSVIGAHDTSMRRVAANSIQFAGSANAAGFATSRTEINKLVSSIADATATNVFTVTIPNAAHSANVEVTLNGSLGAGGAIGANEATGTVKYNVSIARTAGVNAVANISTVYGSSTSSVAGAATITVAGDLSAISGAVGAANTFTIRVTITKGSGSSANHTCTAHAVLLNANSSGITIA